MTNRDILDLTIRLSTGLDQNYDVINMDIVLSVISDLEGTKITKEQLEATRLAKYINHLRRRTKCENLARRAKTLLKKWREMVGIQQASSDTTSQINSNTGICENTNLSENVQSLTFSNPAVQTTIYTEDFNYNKSQNIVSVKNQNHSNTSKAYNTTKPGNLQQLSHNNGIGSNLSIHNAFSNQQPTSFANLIPELMNEKSNVKMDTRENKQTHLKPVSSIPGNCPTETYVIDHSSNSSQESKTGKYGTVSFTEPVVIDIQDSDSEHAQSEPKKSDSTTLSAPIPNLNNTKKGNTSKIKKYKKEKKKKDSNLMPNQNFNCVNITSDTCSNPYQQLIQHDEKSANSYIVANISEILSLSNSSMSTFFPGENDKSSYGLNDNRDLKTHVNNDLTFAGKFKKTNATQNATTIHIRDSIESPAQIISTPSKLDTGTANPSKSLQVNCISNESSSSRLSQFDVLDVVSHDSPHIKTAQEQRSLKQIGTTDITNIASWDNNGTSQSELYKYSLASRPSVVPEVKIPKKRGRKKGSKGVDSLIAKETSLSTQILISALGNGGKKVKTTKELYAEMQNRKLNTNQKQKTSVGPLASTNRNINSKLNLLHPESSCSEISLQSPQTLDTVSTVPTTSTTNAHPDADSDSGSATSEPSHESGDMKKKISNDSNSDSEVYLIKAKESSEIVENPILEDLKKDLLEIIKEIPSPFSLSDIEKNCIADNVPCTCKIVEVDQDADDEFKTKTETQLPAVTMERIDSNSNNVSKNIEKIEMNLQNHIKKHEEVTEQPKKPIKSIFDLDFDDDDDPLEKIKAEVEAAANQQLDSINFDHQYTEHPELLESKETTAEEQPNSQMPHVLEDQSKNLVAPLPQLPLYKIVEDINCVAKEYFQVRTQKITQFHVDVLHNCFIPNINGNWNQSVLQSTKLIEESSPVEKINVVPKYGSLETEAIMKDLSNISFECENIKKKRKFALKQCNSPFLGVAKLLLEEKLGTEKQKEGIELKNQQTKNETSYNVIETDQENCEMLVDASAVDQYDLDGDVQNCVTVNAVLETISVDIDGNHLDSLNTLNPMSDDYKNQNLLQIAEDSTHTLPVEVKTLLNDQTDVENDDYKRENIIDGNNSAESSPSRRSSSCSNSSLKLTQQSINNKLRKLKLRQEQANLFNLKSSNRKRKKKKNISKHDQYDDSNCTKLTNKKKKTVKRLKIAINGDIATQRQISLSSSKSSDDQKSNSETEQSDESVKNDSNDSLLEEVCPNFITAGGDEEDVCCEYDEDDDSSNGVYHEVVTRASTTNGNNHIVLTIKKAPSKTNSPSNSNTISPLNSVSHNVLNTVNDKHSEGPTSIVLSNCESKSHNSNERSTVGAGLAKKDSAEKTEFKIMPTSPTLSTLHKEHLNLFHPDELQMATSNAYEKEFIFKCCKTCNAADKEYGYCKNIAKNENFSISDVVPNKNADVTSENIASDDLSCVSKYDYKCTYSSDINEPNIERGNIQLPVNGPLKEMSSIDKINELEGKCSPREDPFTIDTLPIENNGLLTSFNMIYPVPSNASSLKFGQKNEEVVYPSNCTNYDANSTSVLEAANNDMQLVESQKNNCDEHNSENDSSKHSKQSKYNSNDLNIISRNSSKFLCKKSDLNSTNATHSSTLPYKEYSTGIRAVDEDVDDDDGNNCAKIQQFKEWHQVLQLRSYNDELLTVLPYVILD